MGKLFLANQNVEVHSTVHFPVLGAIVLEGGSVFSPEVTQWLGA
jgi:hypothetical protein